MRRIFTLSVLAVLMLAGAALAQDKATYVGTTKCKMCHNKPDLPIYTSWSATKHASALATLEKADAKVTAEWAEKLKAEVKGPASKSPVCLKCHVVGHGAGGFGADTTKNAAFTGVACEACHGPGSKHMAAPMAEKKKAMQPLPTEAVCKTCHTAVTSPKFDFAEALKGGFPHAKKPAAKG